MKKLVLALLLVSFPVFGQVSAEKNTVSVEKNGGLPIPSGYLTIQDEGSNLPNESILNCVGANITCTDDAANGRTLLTISSGGGTPTGTGFVHITSGVQDGAAALVDLPEIATQAANTAVANVTSGTAAPTAVALPSCTDTGGNHLNYTSGTGYSCGSSTGTAISPLTSQVFFDDFTGSHTSATSADSDAAGWLVTNGAGAGAGSSAITVVANHPGILGLGTGTTGTTASSTIARDASSIQFLLNGSETLDWLVMVPVLSTTNDHFEAQVGLNSGGTTSIEEAVTGLFFTYTDNANSGKWLFHACKSSACGTLDTTVTVVAGTWYHLKFIANSASSYQVIVNGTNAGNFTTAADIPVVGNTLAAKIFCTNNTAVSSKVLQIDYVNWIQTGLTR